MRSFTRCKKPVDTLQADLANLIGSFKALIFSDSPEVNGMVEGSICVNRDRERLTSGDLFEMLRGLKPQQGFTVIWSYFRDVDLGASKGDIDVRDAITRVKRGLHGELAKYPLRNFEVTNNVRRVTHHGVDGAKTYYDADMTITVRRIK